MKADESGLSLSGVEFTPSPAARARAVARARGADAPPVSAAADLFGSITDISAADSSFDLEGQGRASLDAILGDEVPAAAPPVASAPILAPAPAPRVRDAELEANADPFAPPPGVRRALADAPAPARPGPSDSLRLDPGESALGFADAAPTREPTPLDLVGIPSGFFDAVDDSRAIDLEAGGQSSLVLEPELPTATAMPSAFDVDMPSVLPSASEPQKAPSAAWLSRPGDVPRRSRSKATTIPPRQMQVIRPKADTMLTRVASDVPRAAPSPPADAAPAPVRPSGRAASASGSFAATVASARRSVRLDFVRPSFPPPRPLLVAPLMLWTAPPRVAPAEAAEPNPREVRAAASAAPLDNASASQTGERPGMASGAEHLAEPVAEPQAPELEAASGSAAGESAGVLVADDRTSASEPEVAASDDDWVDDLRAAVASGAASSVSPAVSTEPTDAASPQVDASEAVVGAVEASAVESEIAELELDSIEISLEDDGAAELAADAAADAPQAPRSDLADASGWDAGPGASSVRLDAPSTTSLGAPNSSCGRVAPADAPEAPSGVAAAPAEARRPRAVPPPAPRRRPERTSASFAVAQAAANDTSLGVIPYRSTVPTSEHAAVDAADIVAVDEPIAITAEAEAPVGSLSGLGGALAESGATSVLRVDSGVSPSTRSLTSGSNSRFRRVAPTA